MKRVVGTVRARGRVRMLVDRLEGPAAPSSFVCQQAKCVSRMAAFDQCNSIRRVRGIVRTCSAKWTRGPVIGDFTLLVGVD